MEGLSSYSVDQTLWQLQSVYNDSSKGEQGWGLSHQTGVHQAHANIIRKNRKYFLQASPLAAGYAQVQVVNGWLSTMPSRGRNIIKLLGSRAEPCGSLKSSRQLCRQTDK